MKFLIAIALTVIIGVGYYQQDRLGLYLGLYETVSGEDLFKKDDIYYKKFTSTPFTGYVKTQNPKGEFTEKGWLQKGIKSGPWEEDGWLYREKGTYSNTGTYPPKKQGLWISYDKKTGQVQEKENYKDNKYHGMREQFHRDGSVDKKEYYINGKKHGLIESFHKNGRLDFRIKYQNGKIRDGLFKRYFPNGKLLFIGKFKDNEQVGEWRTYNKFGGLNAKFEYRNGYRALEIVYDGEGKEFARFEVINNGKTRYIWKGEIYEEKLGSLDCIDFENQDPTCKAKQKYILMKVDNSWAFESPLDRLGMLFYWFDKF